MAERYLTASTVCEHCGGISTMTPWRWLQDEALNFPKPIYIRGRRLFSENEISAWLEAQRAEAAA